MPQVIAQGKTFSCPVGANLRQVLLENQVDLYNGQARLINCHGIGTCGTCAVAIYGEVSEVNRRDIIRRSLPPHDSQRDLRLACQTKVLGDITVTKFDGFWGQGTAPAWTA